MSMAMAEGAYSAYRNSRKCPWEQVVPESPFFIVLLGTADQAAFFVF